MCDYNICCRLCLHEARDGLNCLFVPKFLSAIKLFFGLEITAKDNCSTRICKECINKLTNISMYRDFVLNNQNTIEEYKLFCDNVKAIKTESEDDDVVFVEQIDGDRPSITDLPLKQVTRKQTARKRTGTPLISKPNFIKLKKLKVVCERIELQGKKEDIVSQIESPDKEMASKNYGENRLKIVKTIESCKKGEMATYKIVDNKTKNMANNTMLELLLNRNELDSVTMETSNLVSKDKLASNSKMSNTKNAAKKVDSIVPQVVNSSKANKTIKKATNANLLPRELTPTPTKPVQPVKTPHSDEKKSKGNISENKTKDTSGKETVNASTTSSTNSVPILKNPESEAERRKLITSTSPCKVPSQNKTPENKLNTTELQTTDLKRTSPNLIPALTAAAFNKKKKKLSMTVNASPSEKKTKDLSKKQPNMVAEMTPSRMERNNMSEKEPTSEKLLPATLPSSTTNLVPSTESPNSNRNKNNPHMSITQCKANLDVNTPPFRRHTINILKKDSKGAKSQTTVQTQFSTNPITSSKNTESSKANLDVNTPPSHRHTMNILPNESINATLQTTGQKSFSANPIPSSQNPDSDPKKLIKSKTKETISTMQSEKNIIPEKNLNPKIERKSIGIVKDNSVPFPKNSSLDKIVPRPVTIVHNLLSAASKTNQKQNFNKVNTLPVATQNIPFLPKPPSHNLNVKTPNCTTSRVHLENEFVSLETLDRQFSSSTIPASNPSVIPTVSSPASTSQTQAAKYSNTNLEYAGYRQRVINANAQTLSSNNMMVNTSVNNNDRLLLSNNNSDIPQNQLTQSKVKVLSVNQVNSNYYNPTNNSSSVVQSVPQNLPFTAPGQAYYNRPNFVLYPSSVPQQYNQMPSWNIPVHPPTSETQIQSPGNTFSICLVRINNEIQIRINSGSKAVHYRSLNNYQLDAVRKSVLDPNSMAQISKALRTFSTDAYSIDLLKSLGVDNLFLKSV